MHPIGIGVLVAMIAFAFGERTARSTVGGALIIIALSFLYVFGRIAMGTI